MADSEHPTNEGAAPEDAPADPWAPREPPAGDADADIGATVRPHEDEQLAERPTEDHPAPEAEDGNGGKQGRSQRRFGARLEALAGTLRNLEGRHSPRESFRFSLVVAAALGLAYWFTAWPLPNLLSGQPDLNVYVVQPLIWLSLTTLAMYGWLHLDDRPPVSRMLIGIAFLVGLFHVSIFLITGVIGSFADSPVAGRLINYPKNLLYLTTLLAGLEASRAYLYCVWRRFGEQLAFGLVSALFFAVVIPAAQWTVWGSFDQITRFVGGRWVPALALSILATFLVRYGGIGPSFAYLFAVIGFQRLSPILPSLDWTILLIIGVTVPLASASLVRSIYEETTEGAARLEGEREGIAPLEEEQPRTALWKQVLGWVGTLGLVVVAALFLLGAFGFRLIVVEGISMEPAYERGDLAIVRENIDLQLLDEGDVIVFEQNGRPIVHRIIEIEETDDGLRFTTQGDNVSRPDLPIDQDQVQGKVVFLLPEIGRLNLWLRGG